MTDVNKNLSGSGVLTTEIVLSDGALVAPQGVTFLTTGISIRDTLAPELEQQLVLMEEQTGMKYPDLKLFVSWPMLGPFSSVVDEDLGGSVPPDWKRHLSKSWEDRGKSWLPTLFAIVPQAQEDERNMHDAIKGNNLVIRAFIEDLVHLWSVSGSQRGLDSVIYVGTHELDLSSGFSPQCLIYVAMLGIALHPSTP